MEISQSFNDSKSLLGGASESIRYFLSHLDSRIDRSLKEYETIVNKESKVWELTNKAKQSFILQRIFGFLGTPLARDNLQTYASEFTFVKFVIENEKCLESQQIQRLFESVKLKSIIEQSGLSIRAALSERLRKVFEPSEDTLEKLSELELLFICYEKLGLQSLFEETFVEELLRRLVKRCGNSAIMRDLVDVTKEILQGELEWLAFLGKYSGEAQLVAAVSRCIGELLVKGMLARGELFPINTLDAFSENYQMFYSLVENVFRGNSVPESLQVAMKKRENLLYKAYVVNVIKKLESSLMQLENFILHSREAIEEYCLKKSKKRLFELVNQLILGNISKDTVTISLLHRVFSLGLRTIIRVRDFFGALYGSVKDPGVLQYLIENHQAMFTNKLVEQVNTNLDEITKKLNIDQSFSDQTKNLFEVRLRDVQTVALSADFKLFLKPSCNLEEEISNAALKLSMQREEPREASVFVKRIEIIFEKYKEKNASQLNSVFASKIWAWTYLEGFISECYSRQQEESRRSALVSKKFGKDKGEEDRLEFYLERQKKLDLKALETLIMG